MMIVLTPPSTIHHPLSTAVLNSYFLMKNSNQVTTFTVPEQNDILSQSSRDFDP